MLVRYIKPRSREAPSRASSTATAGAPGASVKVTRPIGSVRLPVGSLGHWAAALATGAAANGTVHTPLGGAGARAGPGLGLGAGVVGALLGPAPLLAVEPPTLGVGSLTSGVAGSSVRLQAHPSASQFKISAAKAIRQGNPES